eukprot:TRINITY_DN57718_c0_g1_i1.p1 TRINITY_DN57718_c0_g1~~TRINITY_DN57718_c0_g1_i1.p1  ORF type:complete len:1047 (-),score=171.95 TRINITY_DN57718_c0_g1_i1:23-3163(-)
MGALRHCTFEQASWQVWPQPFLLCSTVQCNTTKGSMESSVGSSKVAADEPKIRRRSSLTRAAATLPVSQADIAKLRAQYTESRKEEVEMKSEVRPMRRKSECDLPSLSTAKMSEAIQQENVLIGIATVDDRLSDSPQLLPPKRRCSKADAQASDGASLEASRHLRGSRSSAEYLARQLAEVDGFSPREVQLMKDSFRRFKSVGAPEICCSELPDILDHLGYLGITDEIAASVAKGVSRFSILDFSEYTSVLKVCASKEHALVEESYQKHATAETSGGELRLCMSRFQALLYDLKCSSSWQSVRQSLSRIGFSGLPTDEPPVGPAYCMDFQQVNLALAEHRAWQGCSAEQLAQARMVFDCEARQTLDGCNEVHANELPRMLQELFDEEVHHLASQLCEKINDQADDSDSDQEDLVLEFESDGDNPTAVRVEEHLHSNERKSNRGKRLIAFSEFLIWFRRLRCTLLGVHWERFQKAMQEHDVEQPHEFLSAVVPGLPATESEYSTCLSLAGVPPGQALTFNTFSNCLQHFGQECALGGEDVKLLYEMFKQFEPADKCGLIHRGDCVSLFKAMGHGLSTEETYALLEDANLTSHRSLSFHKFLRTVWFCRKREQGMIKTAFQMFAESESFSDQENGSDLESTMTDSADDDGCAGADTPFSRQASIGGRRSSNSKANQCSRAAFRRRSSARPAAAAVCGEQVDGLVVPGAVCKALEAMGRSLTPVGLEEVSSQIGLSGKKALDLQEFTNLVHLLRQREAEVGRRHAYWSKDEAQKVEVIFCIAGGADDKPLSHEALERLLWNLGVRKGFEELEYLLWQAKVAARSTGADVAGAGITLPVLLHLLNFIRQEGRRRLFDRDSETYFREACTEIDATCFREIFSKLSSMEQDMENFQPRLPARSTSCRGSRDRSIAPVWEVSSALTGRRRSSLLLEVEPTVLSSVLSSLAVRGAIPQVSSSTVLVFLRRLTKSCGKRFLAVEEIQLWNKIEKLGCDRRVDNGSMLDYATFVRIMSWILRTDYAGIRCSARAAGSLAAFMAELTPNGLFDGGHA